MRDPPKLPGKIYLCQSAGRAASTSKSVNQGQLPTEVKPALVTNMVEEVAAVRIEGASLSALALGMMRC